MQRMHPPTYDWGALSSCHVCTLQHMTGEPWVDATHVPPTYDWGALERCHACTLLLMTWEP